MVNDRQHTKSEFPSMLEAALGLAELGVPVFPVYEVDEEGACACRSHACKSPGKHPRTKNGFKDATTDERRIRRWWDKWPEANIGGTGGAHICVDVDVKTGGFESLKVLEQEYGELPKSAVVMTGERGGRRGRHYWFSNPDGIAVASRAGVRKGVDIRADGGYAVLPPSRHASGVRYEWESAPSIGPAPSWVIGLAPKDALRETSWQPNGNFRPSKEVCDFVAGEHEVEQGEQRSFLLRAARSLLTTGRSVEEVAHLLFQGEDGNGGLARCDQDWSKPWEEEQVIELVNDLSRQGPTTRFQSEPDPFWDTEDGAAQLFASEVHEEIRYVAEKKIWLAWQGSRWVVTPELKVRDRVSEFVRSRLDAIQSLDHEKVQARAAWVARFLSRSRLSNVTELAKGPLLAHATDFDSDPHLLNCRNGTLDLRTFELRDARPEDMLTQQVAASYDPEAKSKDWEKVLRESMQSEDLVDYLQRAFGYALLGETREEVFFFCYGKPGAGKGTILESFSGMMGDYARTVNHRSLVQSPGSGSAHSEDIARLHGARFVTASEFERSDKFASALVNNLTGGDTIAARQMYQGTFEFRPQFTLFFAANHKPRMPDSKSGIWRRLRTVPFDHVPSTPDKTLKTRLASDEARSAILTWAIEGLRVWISEGLGELPAEIEVANEDYKEESDPYNLFIEECVSMVPGAHETVESMFAAYQSWASLNGRRSISKAGLGGVLKDRGFEQKQRERKQDGKRKTFRAWIDVEVRHPGAQLPDRGVDHD